MSLLRLEFSVSNCKNVANISVMMMMMMTLHPLKFEDYHINNCKHQNMLYEITETSVMLYRQRTRKRILNTS